MVAWFNLETRAKANIRCLSSILFNSIHTREDHPSQDDFKGIILVRRERTFSRPNISCFELLTVHSFHRRVSRYAGSWVHIVFNTNILYLRKAFPVKWWRMTEGAREMTEMLSKLSCKSLQRDGNKWYFIIKRNDISLILSTIQYFFKLSRMYIYLSLYVLYVHTLCIYFIFHLLPFAEDRPSFFSRCGNSLPRCHYFSHSRFFLFPFRFFFYNWTGRKNRRVRKAVRVDRTEIHGDSRRGDDLPRNRSTCSWHQKPMLTTSNNSSKLSVLSLASLNRKDSRYTALTDVHTPPCVARYIKYVLALGILVSRALWFPGN